MGIEDEVRPGVAGSWDRFVGPRASQAETGGTLAAVIAAAAFADRDPRRRSVLRSAVLRLTAVDLWGGAWVNNTRASVRWYERPGQGACQHLGFAALHAAHPAVIAAVDATGHRRDRASALRWTLGHYGWMLASATVITASPRRQRLLLAIATTGVGLILDRRLGPSTAAPWFAPVYYTKLLVGHAAGSLWNRTGSVS